MQLLHCEHVLIRPVQTASWNHARGSYDCEEVPEHFQTGEVHESLLLASQSVRHRLGLTHGVVQGMIMGPRTAVSMLAGALAG